MVFCSCSQGEFLNFSLNTKHYKMALQQASSTITCILWLIFLSNSFFFFIRLETQICPNILVTYWSSPKSLKDEYQRDVDMGAMYVFLCVASKSWLSHLSHLKNMPVCLSVTWSPGVLLIPSTVTFQPASGFFSFSHTCTHPTKSKSQTRVDCLTNVELHQQPNLNKPNLTWPDQTRALLAEWRWCFVFSKLTFM